MVVVVHGGGGGGGDGGGVGGGGTLVADPLLSVLLVVGDMVLFLVFSLLRSDSLFAPLSSSCC